MRLRTTIIYLAINTVFILLVSCRSYRNGFVTAKELNIFSPDSLKTKLEWVDREKEKLNANTTLIVSDITGHFSRNENIKAKEINNLYDNLFQQFQYDQFYQSISQLSSGDSIKNSGWRSLMNSANYYNATFQHPRLLRRIINRGDAAHHIEHNSLLHAQLFFWNKHNQEQFLKSHSNIPLPQNSRSQFICSKHCDNFFHTTYKIAGFGSQLFSLAIAAIHSKPKPDENIKRLMPYLKKWDIVCQKSSKRFTDKFIPGFFGHSGIYLGDSIFAEVIQNGVIYSSPRKFLEGDHFIVIRPNTITNQQTGRMEKFLKLQIGKKYDFNFNIESPDRLICTELIYYVYDFVDWETKRVAGRYTLSPDHLVKTALANKEFEIPIYMDEKEIIENPNQSFVENLLNKK